MIDEIVAWSDPFGAARPMVRGLRMSEVTAKAPFRCFMVPEDDLSGHALFEAVSGLRGFLTARGWQEKAILAALGA